MKRTALGHIRVFRSPLDHSRGLLVAGPLRLPCVLGRGGAKRDKREGDGATPMGRHRLIQAFYRPDRGPRPRTLLPLRPIRPQDGWCDDPRHRLYNRPVRLPFSGSHEEMWREDRVYDLVVDLACNRGPIRKGRGSAIFLHLARPDRAPTAGCVALAPADARRLLERLAPRTRIHVAG